MRRIQFCWAVARGFWRILCWPSVGIKFEVRDLWVGIYWDLPLSMTGKVIALDMYLCIVPCLPILLTWGVPKDRRSADWSDL